MLKEIYLGIILVLNGCFVAKAVNYGLDENYLKAIYSMCWAIMLQLLWIISK